GEYAASQEAHPPQRAAHDHQPRSREPHPHLPQAGGECDRVGLARGCAGCARPSAAGAAARGRQGRAAQEHRRAPLLAAQQARRRARL
ncbi:MAG: SSU ribosomal protein S20p, partial [uncultured Sphingomonadaceae bacterium]